MSQIDQILNDGQQSQETALLADAVAKVNAAVVEMQDLGALTVEKAQQLANHERLMGTAADPGHIKIGIGFERTEDGTVNVVGTADFEAAVNAHKIDPSAHGLDAVVSGINAELAKKAEKTAVDAELAQKADTETVNAGLAKKADTTMLTAGLAKKADSATVTADLAKKADKTVTEAAFAQNTTDHANLTASVAAAKSTADAALARDPLPSMAGAAGKFLTTDGAVAQWKQLDTLTVVNAPTVTLAARLPIGYPQTMAMRASSRLIDGNVASFFVTVGAGEPVSVAATDNAASYAVTAQGNVGDVLPVSVVAVDNFGYQSAPVTQTAVLERASVNAPVVTSPAAGAVVSAVSIPVTGSAFSATGATDSQKRRRARICSPDGTVLFTGPWVTGNVTSLTLSPSPALSPKASVKLQLQDEGNLLGESLWSAPVAVTVASVVQPTILSPTEGAEVTNNNITVVTSPLSLTGGLTDTLAGADYTIYNTSGGVVASAKGISSTTHVFAAPAVSLGSYYDLGVVQHSKNYGASLESAKRRIKIKTEIITPGGRKLYRHSSNKGTVMEFTDGQLRKVLVLDAAYREKRQWGAYGDDMPNLTNYTRNNTRGDKYLNTSNVENTDAATVMTDAQINALWGDVIDKNMAKQNCDQWMTRNGTTDTRGIVGVPAVAFARSITVDGNLCNVPNIQTLMRIFLEADALDSLDPTVAANRTKSLGMQNSGGFWACMNLYFAWSCTENDGGSVRYVRYFGDCEGATKYSTSFVIPVLEL